MWESAMNEATLLYNIPLVAGKVLKSNVNMIHKIYLKALTLAAKVAMDQVKNIIGNDSNSKAEDKDNGPSLCETIFKCKATMEYLIPKDSSSDSAMIRTLVPDSKIRDSIRSYVYNDLDIENNYDLFDKYYCKLSLSLEVESIISALILSLYAQLKEYLNSIKELNNQIDRLITEYMKACEPFLDFLDGLDKFEKCAFAICDYATTKENYVYDMHEKLYLTKYNGVYITSSIPWVTQFYDEASKSEEDIDNTLKGMEDWMDTNFDPELRAKAQQVKPGATPTGKSYL